MEYKTGISELDSQFLARCVVVGSLAKASVLLKFASSRCKKKEKKRRIVGTARQLGAAPYAKAGVGCRASLQSKTSTFAGQP